MSKSPLPLLGLGILIFGLANLNLHAAWGPPAGFGIPEETISPDGNYGVLVPDYDHYRADGPPQNQLVNVKTGAVLTTLETRTFFQGTDSHMNHVSLQAGWSRDGSVLGWILGGKWFPFAFVLVKLENGKATWQTNVLKSIQQKMLAETRTAAPKNYAAARKQNRDNGSAYPEGFTIDLNVPEAGFTLPFRGQATLDSNPKSITDGWPAEANVSATMNFVVNADGRIVYSDFAIDPSQTGISRDSGDESTNSSVKP